MDPYGQFYSPYLGMGNNPVKFIDVDGGKIIVGKKGVGRFYFKNGSLYDVKTNEIYSGNDKFLVATREALSKLDYATDKLTQDEDGNLKRVGIIADIVNSEDIYNIHYSKSKHWTTGHVTIIDNRATVRTPTSKGIIKSPYEITLVHELGHQFSLNNGLKNSNPWFQMQGQKYPSSYDENFASVFENIFREALGLPMRTHYAKFDNKPFEPSRVFWPGAGSTWKSKTFPSPRYF